MRDVHFAVVVLDRGFHGLQYLYFCVSDRIRKVIRVHPLHVSPTLGDIELMHIVLLPLMQIDRFLMKRRKRAGVVHLSDNTGRTAGFDNDKIVGAHTA